MVYPGLVLHAQATISLIPSGFIHGTLLDTALGSDLWMPEQSVAIPQR